MCAYRILRRWSHTTTCYVTTPIFYPNAAPHIGHLHSLVTADIFARYRRLTDSSLQVHYLTGTDDHGLKIQQAAAAAGLPPRQFCDELSSRFKALAGAANISSTVFTRTSDPTHHRTVQHVWSQLDAQNLIHKTNYQGWYSVTDECFYTPRQVTPAPTPDNPRAHVATSTGSPVEWHQEQNYVFRLGAFRSQLLQHYLNHPNAIHPPQYHADIVHSLKSDNDDQALEELSISRPSERLSWGVQVPGDPSQTVYVWFDALLVYLSAIGYPDPVATTGLSAPWPPNLQVIGKDILRFHAIYLPAILIALGLPLSRQILTHSHWTVDQKKMSKSTGNVADPIQAISQYGVDVVRWYLGRVGGRWRTDVDWSQPQLEKHGDEIRSMLGNYFLRATSSKLIERALAAHPLSLDEILENSQARPDQYSKGLIQLISLQRETAKKVREKMQNLEVAEALRHLIELMHIVCYFSALCEPFVNGQNKANKTVTDIAPWKKSVPQDLVYATYTTAIETLRVLGICLQPFIPCTAQVLMDALGLKEDGRLWCDAERSGGKEDVKPVGSIIGVRLF